MHPGGRGFESRWLHLDLSALRVYRKPSSPRSAGRPASEQVASGWTRVHRSSRGTSDRKEEYCMGKDVARLKSDAWNQAAVAGTRRGAAPGRTDGGPGGVRRAGSGLPAVLEHSLPAAVPEQPLHGQGQLQRPPASASTCRRPRCRPTSANSQIEVAEYNRNDGFSPGSDIVVRVPGLDNPAAFDKTNPVPLTDMSQASKPSAADRRHRRRDRTSAGDLGGARLQRLRRRAHDAADPSRRRTSPRGTATSSRCAT